MSVAERTARAASPEAPPPPSFTERLEAAAQRHVFPDLPPSRQTQHSDLNKDFAHFLYVLKGQGRDVARRETKKMLSGNFLSIAKEMKGRQWMQTAFKVKRSEQETLFQRSEFKGGEDLRKYSTTVDATIKNPAERARFLKENLQMVELFDTLSSWLVALDWSDDSAEMIDQLTHLPDGNHFVETTLPVSKELQILFPDLKKYAGQNLTTYVSRPLVSVSPTSSVHLKRQTSLAWVNRLVFIPEIGELVFLRDGIFSAYNDEEIAEFLTLDEDWPELSTDDVGEVATAAEIFSTEEELFAFIAALPDEYKQKHAHVILEEVINRLGGFKPAPKIANVKDEMTLDIEALSEAVLDIFEWELLTYGQDAAAAQVVSERLNYLKNNFLHHLATDTTIEWDQAIQHYQTFFGQRQKAVKPEEHVKEAEEAYSKFYPKLGQIRVDLSVLDCGVGSVIGGFKSMNLEDLKGVIGVEGLSLLRRYEHRPIQTQDELIEFCHQFNKDWRRFNKKGECRGCHHHTFLGECDVCPVCEVKDDFGIGSLGELDRVDWERQGTSQLDAEGAYGQGASTLGLVVASLATKQVMEEAYWEQFGI